MYGITIFGDSITFGRGDNLNRGWCGRLRKYFEAKDYYNCLYNQGIPGDTTNGLLKRIDAEAKSRLRYVRDEDRHVIIISIGINDSKYVGKEHKELISFEDFKKNIDLLIEKAKKYTSEVLFIGLTPVDEKFALNYENKSFPNKRIEAFNNIIRECCQEKDIPYLNMFKEFSKLEYKTLLGDGLHPNPKGYEKMYELVKEFLIENKILINVKNPSI